MFLDKIPLQLDRVVHNLVMRQPFLLHEARAADNRTHEAIAAADADLKEAGLHQMTSVTAYLLVSGGKNREDKESFVPSLRVNVFQEGGLAV
uniref:Nitroreductase domain-containing protein n=1 Tax=Steinernema glaseri TaxID=37863 RepID=A0A1I7ZQH3_9BILA